MSATLARRPPSTIWAGVVLIAWASYIPTKHTAPLATPSPSPSPSQEMAETSKAAENIGVGQAAKYANRNTPKLCPPDSREEIPKSCPKQDPMIEANIVPTSTLSDTSRPSWPYFGQVWSTWTDLEKYRRKFAQCVPGSAKFPTTCERGCAACLEIVSYLAKPPTRQNPKIADKLDSGPHSQQIGFRMRGGERPQIGQKVGRRRRQRSRSKNTSPATPAK